MIRSSVAYGAMLGFFNALFIAIGMNMYANTGVGVGIVVFMFGIIPALVTGAVLGLVADRTAKSPVWFRILVLALPACAVLIGMAEMFGVEHMFFVALIPTVVCALVLERHSRHVDDVPSAVVK